MSWIRSVALTRAADYMLANGIEPADLVRKLQLPLSALLDGDLWINRDRVFQLSTDLARITGNACFGLHIREAGDFEMYGRWGEGIVHSNNLGNAIGYAAHELRGEDCSVTDVAFILGYSDSGHFTRAFKRWAGCTPRDFRSKEDVDLPALQMCLLEEPLPNVLPTASGSDDRLTAPSFTRS